MAPEFEAKIKIARHQLGSALQMFIYDQDPISVHCLACGGGELVEQVAIKIAVEPLRTHIFESVPNMDIRRYRQLRNQFWNAFKHLTDRRDIIREDMDLISSFKDEQNDAALFCGWYDYMSIKGTLPIAAQVFQIWFFSLNEDKLSTNVDPTPYRDFFDKIRSADRKEQKRQLRRAVEKYQKAKTLLDDKKTENFLVLRL